MRPSASEYKQREDASRDAQTLLTACLFCKWIYLGTALEGRERALQHRLRRHPDAKPAKRRSRNLRAWQHKRLSKAEEAEILEERTKRAHLHGLEIT